MSGDTQEKRDRIAGLGTKVLNPRPLVHDVEVVLTKYPTATISSDDDDKLRTWNCRSMHAAQIDISTPTAWSPMACRYSASRT